MTSKLRVEKGKPHKFPNAKFHWGRGCRLSYRGSNWRKGKRPEGWALIGIDQTQVVGISRLSKKTNTGGEEINVYTIKTREKET